MLQFDNGKRDRFGGRWSSLRYQPNAIRHGEKYGCERHPFFGVSYRVQAAKQGGKQAVINALAKIGTGIADGSFRPR
jgi:hypothetical protein